MFTVLIIWVALGGGETMSQQVVSPQMCETMRDIATMQPTVKAAACVHNTEMAIEALSVGKCQPLDAADKPFTAYVCNGKLPNWK